MKPIEDIEVGDKVLAYDQHTGKQAYKKVTRLFRNKTDKWYHVHVNEQDIVCTAGHPFYVADLEMFVTAKDLKVGQSVLLADGTCAVIEEIRVQKLRTPETTYNFEVEDYHTYYFSDDKVLVHNDCAVPIDAPQKITGYTQHGLERAMGRDGYGVSPKGILDAFKNPKRIVYDVRYDTFKFTGQKSVVVLNRQGQIVTTWAKGSMYWRLR